MDSESVWNYPRPPRVERCEHRVRVIFNGETVADSTKVWRVLETSHPPTYYIPREDVPDEFMLASSRRSFCEFKGTARYWDLKVGERVSRDAAWSYSSPNEPYSPLAGHFAFYPSRVDACFVGEERVLAQEGDFYGGWITANLVGPFKGAVLELSAGRRGKWGSCGRKKYVSIPQTIINRSSLEKTWESTAR